MGLPRGYLKFSHNPIRILIPGRIGHAQLSTSPLKQRHAAQRSPRWLSAPPRPRPEGAGDSCGEAATALLPASAEETVDGDINTAWTASVKQSESGRSRYGFRGFT